MAKVYGNYNSDQASNPPGIGGPQQEARFKTIRNVFDLSKQAVVGIADTPVVGRALKGWSFRGGSILVDTSLGTSTIAVGNATTPAKYKAAATAATVNTPVPFAGAVAAGGYDPLTADEEIILTVAVGPLPAAGKIYVDLDFYLP